MYTVKSVMTQLADPEVILKHVRDSLRMIDPKFTKEEQRYYAAVNALKETGIPYLPVPQRT